jgi:hypothetical protein
MDMTEQRAAKGPAKGNELIAKLIKGAERACEDYIALSGNPFPGHAPESFIQAGTARELLKVEKTWVVLEDSVADVYKAANTKKKGPAKSKVAKGYYDLVLYWKNGKPRAAIEVKSPVNVLSKQQYEKDFHRLIQSMNGHPESTFQYGIFLFLTVKKGAKTDFEKSKIELQALVEKLRIEAVSIAAKTSKMSLKVSTHEGKFHEIKADEEQGAWRISAIVFKR